MYFKINGTDFSDLVSGLRVGYETLVSENSGRNASGNTVLDIINTKRKVYVTLRHTTDEEMSKFLTAIKGYVVEVSYRDPVTRALRSMTAYTGTPEPEYYTIQKNLVVYKPLNLNFVEL